MTQKQLIEKFKEFAQGVVNDKSLDVTSIIEIGDDLSEIGFRMLSQLGGVINFNEVRLILKVHPKNTKNFYEQE